MTQMNNTNDYLNTSVVLDDIKKLVKKIKGLTYHKRSKKFQVQVFFNDPDKIINTTGKKHTFKSKSFTTIQEAIIGRTQIINNIHNLIPNENPIESFNKILWSEFKIQYQELINIYQSDIENEVGESKPRENEDCYICMEDFVEGEETISICGNENHHIHKSCYDMAAAAEQTAHEYLGYINTNSRCGICRGTPNMNTNPNVKCRNDKRREFMKLLSYEYNFVVRN